MTPQRNWNIACAAAIVCAFVLAAQTSASDAGASTGAPDAASSAVEPSGISFERQIAPILRSRCIACHNEARAEGELRLETKSAAERGGHTGNPIFHPVDRSEFLKRVTSDDSSYRMPKDEAPLSHEQIQILEKWIREGAPWPADARIEAEASAEGELHAGQSAGGFDLAAIDRWWSRAEPVLAPIWWSFYAGIVGCVAILIIEGRRRKAARQTEGTAAPSHALDRLAARIGLSHYALGLSLLALVAVSQLYANLLAERTQLAAALAGSPGEEPESDVRGGARPAYRTNHPPRLGGIYYRGNDERDPRLYNGGFYRTATFTLELVSSQGDRLRWGDAAPNGPIFAALRIERSPSTTKQLFTDAALTECTIARSDATEGDSPRDEPVAFQVVRAGEEWLALYPIDQGDDQDGEGARGAVGELSIHPGKLDPHYLIRYSVRIENGVVQPDSFLHLEPLLFTSRILLPEEDEIPLDEWFSFRPIPEIEGSNVDDPELLGVTEHLERAANPQSGEPATPPLP